MKKTEDSNSYKKKYIYALLAVVLVIIAAVGMMYSSPLASKGKFTGIVTKDIVLEKGWNMVSVPYTGIKTPVSSDCTITAIYHFNSAKTPQGYDQVLSLDNLKPGYGYWIRHNPPASAPATQCKITFLAENGAGISSSTLGENSDGILNKGWNQIGGTFQAVNVADIKGDCTITAVYYFNSAKAPQGYDQIDLITGQLEPGKAYWIRHNPPATASVTTCTLTAGKGGEPAVVAVIPTITTTTLSSATVNQPYSSQISATGSEPLTFSLSSGTLPAGLSLSSSGLISGTPTTSGTFTFAVIGVNSAGQSAPQSLSLTVAPPAPLVSLSYWSGDIDATDSKGLNNGVLKNGLVVSPGKTGNAFNLDGVDDYVDVLDSPSLTFTNKMSISLWFKQSSLATDKPLVSKWNHGISSTFVLQTDQTNSNQLKLFVATSAGDAGGTANMVTTNANLAANTWYNAVLVYDGSSSEKAKIYLNGVKLSTTVTAKTLYSVYFTSPTTGYAVGDSGTILKTSDAGQTWTSQTSGTTTYLLDVYFTDPSTGYAVGGLNTILKTTDAGQTWTKLNSGAGSTLNSVYFTDPTTGYAAGNGGTILKTLDAGQTWTSQTSGATEYLLDIYFTSPTTGYTVGGLGTILKTSDAGQTWTSQTSGTSNALRSVYFTDANTGHVVGQTGTILKTTDAGLTWTSQTSGTSNQLFGVYFTNPSTGYAVGNSGTILKTLDAGLTWTSQTSGTTQQLNSVYFTDANTGHAVGLGGTILKTTNSGTTWTKQILDTLPTTLVDSTAPLEIGSVASLSRFFNGQIDEVEIYNDALSDLKVKEIYDKAPATPISKWSAEADAKDSVGTHHGTLKNGASIAPGKIGNAFNLDGVDDYVDVGSGFDLDSMTLSTWINIDPAKNTGERRIISKDNIGLTGTRKTFALKSTASSVNANGKPTFGIYTSTNGQDFVSSPTVLTSGWHHIAGVRDTSAGRLELYVDGVLVASKAAPFNVIGPVDSAANTVIGQVSPGYTGEFFPGMIDEAEIYSNALSGSQIKNIYDKGAVQQTSLIAKLSADIDGRDNTGNNHGTLKNGTSIVPGKIGNAFTLDGVDDYVEIADSPSLTFTDKMSISLWFKQDALAASKPLVTKWLHGISQTFSLQISHINSDEIGMYTAVSHTDTGLSGYVTTTNANLVAGNWYHLVAVYDGSASEKIRIYLNGNKLSLTASGTVPNSLLDSTASLDIGSLSSLGRFFNGQIDEVEIFNDVLSESQIQNLYNKAPVQVIANTWTTQTTSVGGKNSVYFTDANTGYAVGNVRSLYKTTDAGITWTNMPGTASETNPNSHFNSIYFTSASTGYIVGNEGIILKTIDAGLTWTSQTSGKTEALTSVYFTDANTGYVVGGSGAILKTLDGGATWTPQTSTANSLNSVYFTSASTGYAVGTIAGSGAAVFKTTDAGTTWTAIQQPGGVTNTLFSIYFANPTTGYIVGGSGAVLKTTDAGSTWTAQTSGTSNALRSVYFTDANTGWTVGDAGTILKTLDAGVTWTAQTSGTAAILKSVYFVNSGTGWAVGNGVILKAS